MILLFLGLFLTSLIHASESHTRLVAVDCGDAVAYNLGDWTLEVNKKSVKPDTFIQQQLMKVREILASRASLSEKTIQADSNFFKQNQTNKVLLNYTSEKLEILSQSTTDFERGYRLNLIMLWVALKHKEIVEPSTYKQPNKQSFIQSMLQKKPCIIIFGTMLLPLAYMLSYHQS